MNYFRYIFARWHILIGGFFLEHKMYYRTMAQFKRALSLLDSADNEEMGTIVNKLTAALIKVSPVEGPEEVYLKSIEIKEALLGKDNKFAAESIESSGRVS